MTQRSILFLVAATLLAICTSSISTPTLAGVIFTDTSIGGGQLGGFYGEYLPTDFTLPTLPPPIAAPDNDPTFQNYFMGRTSTASFTTSERRVFFIYDLTGIPLPAGEKVVDVSIDLELLPGGTSALANFTGDIELVEFSATPFSAAEIKDPAAFALDPLAIWDTFGTGPLYGAFELVVPTHPVLPPTPPDVYTIPLPGAVADTESALGSDFLVITARLASYDPDPIELLGFGSAIDPYEYVFGLTDVVTPSGPGIPAPDLIITTVTIPEPTSATIALMLIGIAFCSCRLV